MGSVWTRIKLACAAFFTILFKGRLPSALQAVHPEPLTAPAADDRSDRAVQIVALLQRDGRLVDFLMEDLSAYADAQIGAAVRDVHAGCRRVLDRYLTLDSVVTGREGEPVAIAPGADPASVRLVGNVAAAAPGTGTLLHRGWRITRIDLPPLGDAGARTIVAPAEIEVA
jgi:hypothetical protein